MSRQSSFGQRVKRRRQSLGLTQHELARRARVSQPRISQIEHDQTTNPLPLRTLTDLADALGVDVGDLIAGDPLYDRLDREEPPPRLPLPADLPRATMPLIGRDDDLAAVGRRLRDNEVRLVTLTGPGGVGKTHLAVCLAADLEEAFPEPPTIVSLAAATDAAQVVSAVAQAIGLRERDARPLRDRLLAELRPSRRLLLLDNAEQVLSAVAFLAAELLAECPNLKLLVTSRAPLRIRDEHAYPVSPLEVPVDQGAAVEEVATSPAVRLFVERAGAALGRFALTETNTATVAAICRELDGLPLAIELAAARIRIFPPDDLLRRLDRRLTLLTDGPRDLPPRQRTLRETIAWSDNLLTPEERALFHRLSIFAGAFTIEAAEYVGGQADRRTGGETESRETPCRPSVRLPVFEGIAGLLQQSLLTRTVEPDGSLRFGMLETVRAYGRERLEASGEVDTLRRRHLDWCLGLATRAVPHLFTAQENAWLGRLRREDANLRAALDWAFGCGRATDLESGLLLAAALTDYWYLSGHLSDGRDRLLQAIDLSRNSEPTIGRARVLVGACLIEQTQGVIDPAERHGAEGLALAKEIDDPPTFGRAVVLLGNLATMRGDLDRSCGLYEEALALFRRLGDRPWTALALIDLGICAYRQGDPARAAGYAEQALVIAREVGDVGDTIVALCLLGDATRDRGDLERAATLFADGLALSWRRGNEREVAECLSGLGTVAVEEGEWERAACLLGAAETLYRKLEIDIAPPHRPDWPVAVRKVRAGLDPEIFDRAWATSPVRAVAEIFGQETPPRTWPARRGVAKV
ncbi:MAG: hypothetical protein QOJ59_5431, partial [Thermomicrobiales bacterium]|nr:hypothetical protein [Thermomicrobiales bacterium]